MIGFFTKLLVLVNILNMDVSLAGICCSKSAGERTEEAPSGNRQAVSPPQVEESSADPLPSSISDAEISRLAERLDAIRGPEKLMGIEVETPSIKVYPAVGGKPGFRIRLRNRGEVTIMTKSYYWVLEDDTLDVPVSSELPLRNLECRTIDGFSQERIVDAAQDIQGVMQELHRRAPSVNFMEIDAETLREILGRSGVSLMNDERESIGIQSKPEKNELVRMQITYQLPFEDIPRVFGRLGELGHKGIQEFLSDLDPEKAVPPLHGRLQKTRERHQLRTFFKERVTPVFATIRENHLKGFCCLFLYYWYELFNNQERFNGEPGLKRRVGIMSRIPFSQLYDSLPVDAQAEFCAKIGGIIEEFGNDHRLMKYNNYGDEPVEANLTIQDWYLSITEVGQRSRVGRRDVDRLSPPPNLPSYDSMGMMDIRENSDGFPLIELRGYASNEVVNGVPQRIENITQLVMNESSWFFN